MELLEQMMSTWLEGQNQHHVPVSMLLVQPKAISIYEDLSKGDDNVKPFSAQVQVGLAGS
jgi:hypothetical protein